MPVRLTNIEQLELVRITCQSAAEAAHETIAVHFIALGLERGALRCEKLAALTRKKSGPSDALARAFEIAAAAIRADKH